MVRSAIPLALLAIGFHTSPALADRAQSPTDALDDFAIESALQLGSSHTTRAVYAGGGAHFEDLSLSSWRLTTRVWPGAGAHVGFRVGLENVEPSEPGAGLAKGRALTDVVVEGGLRRRIGPSVSYGAQLELTLPVGGDLSTDDRTDVLVTPMAGFSFTPRHDFYIEVPLGYASGDRSGDRSGWRWGFRGGMTYQRERFVLLGMGFNQWHRENVASYTSSGGELALGWETIPGVTVMFRLQVAGSSAASVAGQVDHYYSDLFAVELTWVYYPSGRQNRLRRAQRGRGIDFLWWNPMDPRYGKT